MNDGDARIVELLEAHVALQREHNSLLRDVAARLGVRRHHAPLSNADNVLLTRLLPAIYGRWTEATFAVKDLHDVAEARSGPSARALGHVFSRAEGIAVAGFAVERIGKTRDEMAWKVVARVL